MELLVFLNFILFACQEKTDYGTELDEIRSQIYQHQVTIDELEARIAILTQENDVLEDQLYNITSGVDIVGLYSTVQQNIQKIAANTAGIAGQSTQLANLSIDVSDNKADILANTSLTTNNNNAMDGRVLDLELYSVQSTDLLGYATQGWVNAQNFASQASVTTNGNLIGTNASSISSNSSTLVAHDGRIALIEGAFITVTDLTGYASQSWVESQGYSLQTDLDTTNSDISTLSSSVLTIASDYLVANDIAGYATESWVQSQGYATASLGNLSNYVTVDTIANTITFSGANVHIESGSGSTMDSSTGLGNLFIGYNESNGTETRTGAHNLIVGPYHTYANYGALIAGYRNSVTGPHSSVSGGYQNTATGDYTSISGGYSNSASAEAAAVAAGYNNSATGLYSGVNGGENNTASDAYDVQPPYTNIDHLASYMSIDTSNNAITFSGANIHIESGSGSTDDNESLTNLGNLIIGYDENNGANSKSGSHNLVIGDNHSYTSHSGFVSGLENTISGPYAAILGGFANTASAEGAMISGGSNNTASGSYASISGGDVGTASGEYSSICGGYTGTASGSYAVIGGGDTNTASGEYSSVTAGTSNTVSAQGAVISGGRLNEVDASYGVISAGASNYVTSTYGVITGGNSNTVSGYHAVITGGRDHIASGDYCSINGGYTNLASGEYSVVGGGEDNTASGYSSVVSGGRANTASGSRAAVSGGYLNTAATLSSVVSGSSNATTTSGYEHLP